ncbi:hypothetical protein F1193_16550 [Blastochloris sulfoviridis]|uniref:Uncharacterized protein n=1 Tax=Blastochloris sulfoviridis TaxID=50712 RepID=A0A5M6HI20_9HYPH|nr:hypothetical protein F1193_16550 [Blastochloris sulfoviridis]
MPGVVTKVAAWKLDPVHCATLKIGAPRASVAALSDLHGLLIACESRLPSANGNTVTQEGHDGIADTARTSNAAGFETAVGSLDNTASDGKITFEEQPNAVNYGVIDEITRRVLQAGGHVVAARRADVPGGGPLAVLLRYPV